MLVVETAKTSAPVALEALDAPYHVGAVALRVADLAGLTAFYRDGIGLAVIREEPGVALLGSAEAGTAAAPSFTRDVAPIVRDKCAGCHRLGGIAPFAFRTAHDVSSKATLIAAAVQERRMPPWPPGPQSARFAGQDRRTLSPAAP